MHDPHHLPPRFDRLARSYRSLEYLTLGRQLEHTREHFLPALGLARSALLLGDGDGRFCQALLRRWPGIQVDAVDGSPAMLAALKARCVANSVRTTLADLRVFTPDRPVDLITTHFVLDCLAQPEVKDLIERVAPILAPGGLWLVSEFQTPRGAMHWPARAYIRALYLAFRILTGLRVTNLPDHATPLHEAGLVLIAERRRLFGLLTSQLWRKPLSAFLSR